MAKAAIIAEMIKDLRFMSHSSSGGSSSDPVCLRDDFHAPGVLHANFDDPVCL